MGMVFQSFNLFPHMTVLQNVIEAPLTVKRMPRDAIVPAAEELLRKVGLLNKRDNYPAGCPADRSSAWPSRGRWPWNRTSCCSTSRPRRWIPS